jgi:cold shock protein
MTGVVVSWKLNDNGKRGTYGWVRPDESNDGKNVFVHFSAIESDGFRYLNEGDVVEFDIEVTEKGSQALNVRVIEN